MDEFIVLLTYKRHRLPPVCRVSHVPGNVVSRIVPKNLDRPHRYEISPTCRWLFGRARFVIIYRWRTRVCPLCNRLICVRLDSPADPTGDARRRRRIALMRLFSDKPVVCFTVCLRAHPTQARNSRPAGNPKTVL